MEEFEGKTAVVTGAASGMGRAMARRFADAKMRVVLADVEVAPLRETEEALLERGADVIAVETDVRKLDSIEELHRRAIDAFGKIHVLCNNAGIAAIGDVVTATLHDWTSTFAVNVFGLASMSRAVLPNMRAVNAGVIVNTCSVAAFVGLVQRAVYSASKGAVLALTKAMAADEIAYGIRVNCVSPGTVWSPWVERVVSTTADPAATVEAMRKRQPMGWSRLKKLLMPWPI